MKKLPTLTMATVFALASTFALAQGGGDAGSPGVDRTNNNMGTQSGMSGTTASPGMTTGTAKTKKMAPKNAKDLGDKTGEKLRN